MVEKFRTWKNSGKEFFDSIIITEKTGKSRGKYGYIVKTRMEKDVEKRKTTGKTGGSGGSRTGITGSALQEDFYRFFVCRKGQLPPR